MNHPMKSKKMAEERREFHKNLVNLVKSEYEEIFRILKLSDEQFSENSNGIFFDVLSIKDDTFEKMKHYMNFCLETRKNQNERIEQLKNITHELNEE